MLPVILSRQSAYLFSRRGSKLIVEVIIGVIGLLGIALAQVTEPVPVYLSGEDRVILSISKGVEVSSSQDKFLLVTPAVDWLEILF